MLHPAFFFSFSSINFMQQRLSKPYDGTDRIRILYTSLFHCEVFPSYPSNQNFIHLFIHFLSTHSSILLHKFKHVVHPFRTLSIYLPCTPLTENKDWRSMLLKSFKNIGETLTSNTTAMLLKLKLTEITLDSTDLSRFFMQERRTKKKLTLSKQTEAKSKRKHT